MPNPPLYVKTAKGIEEIERRTWRLQMRHRKVLIVIDGKRDEAALSEVFPGDDLPAILLALLNDGFVQPLEQAPQPASATPQPSAPTNVPANDEERFSMARNFMVNTTRAYIGINGSSLIDGVDACTDLDALRHLFDAWRQAIQLSREGKKDIAKLESQLAGLLS